MQQEGTQQPSTYVSATFVDYMFSLILVAFILCKTRVISCHGKVKYQSKINHASNLATIFATIEIRALKNAILKISFRRSLLKQVTPFYTQIVLQWYIMTMLNSWVNTTIIRIIVFKVLWNEVSCFSLWACILFIVSSRSDIWNATKENS